MHARMVPAFLLVTDLRRHDRSRPTRPVQSLRSGDGAPVREWATASAQSNGLEPGLRQQAVTGGRGMHPVGRPLLRRGPHRGGREQAVCRN